MVWTSSGWWFDVLILNSSFYFPWCLQSDTTVYFEDGRKFNNDGDSTVLLVTFMDSNLDDTKCKEVSQQVFKVSTLNVNTFNSFTLPITVLPFHSHLSASKPTISTAR
jgi:hypothetical protein